MPSPPNADVRDRYQDSKCVVEESLLMPTSRERYVQSGTPSVSSDSMGCVSRRQLKAQRAVLRENSGPFHGIWELADVAGPVVGGELFGMSFGETRRRTIHFPRGNTDISRKMLCIQRTRNHGVFAYYALFLDWNRILYPVLEIGLRAVLCNTRFSLKSGRRFIPQRLIVRAQCVKEAKHG